MPRPEAGDIRDERLDRVRGLNERQAPGGAQLLRQRVSARHELRVGDRAAIAAVHGRGTVTERLQLTDKRHRTWNILHGG